MEDPCLLRPRPRRAGFEWTFALAVALGSSAFAPHAGAQAATDAQPSHEKRAQVAYALQDWPTTIREFQAAFQEQQKPDYLWGIAQAQRLSGDCTAAITTYKAYRRSEISAEQVSAADNQIAHCEAEVQKKQQVTAVSASPQPAATTASKTPPAEPTGPPQASSTSPDSNTPFYADAAGDILFLTGVAAAGVGTYFLIKGNSAMRDSAHSSFADYDADAHHASREQLVGVTTLAGGGLFMALGVVRYLTIGGSSTGPGSALTITPLGLDWHGRF